MYPPYLRVLFSRNSALSMNIDLVLAFIVILALCANRPDTWGQMEFTLDAISNADPQALFQIGVSAGYWEQPGIPSNFRRLGFVICFLAGLLPLGKEREILEISACFSNDLIEPTAKLLELLPLALVRSQACAIKRLTPLFSAILSHPPAGSGAAYGVLCLRMTELKTPRLLSLPDDMLRLISEFCDLTTRCAVTCTNSTALNSVLLGWVLLDE